MRIESGCRRAKADRRVSRKRMAMRCGSIAEGGWDTETNSGTEAEVIAEVEVSQVSYRQGVELRM